MDVIITDTARIDKGVLKRYDIDYEASSDGKKCTFSIKAPLKGSLMEPGGYWYIEGEEYGGRFDSREINTANGQLTMTGRTWRGILASKIVEPEGDRYSAIGNADTVLRLLVQKLDLTDIFTVDGDGGPFVMYQFRRYVDAYTGIIDMLARNGQRLKLEWREGKVHIQSTPAKDWSEEKELNSDLYDFRIKDSRTRINHMIGLGQGELSERQVVHRYIDENGDLSDTQHFFGVEEVVGVYENVNAEDIVALTTETEDALREAGTEGAVDITLYDFNGAEIGDYFTASEETTGLVIREKITDKILTLTEGVKAQISYKAGAEI